MDLYKYIRFRILRSHEGWLPMWLDYSSYSAQREFWEKMTNVVSFDSEKLLAENPGLWPGYWQEEDSKSYLELEQVLKILMRIPTVMKSRILVHAYMGNDLKKMEAMGPVNMNQLEFEARLGVI